MCYTFGHTFGYLCEQVAVGALTGGTVKVAQVALKGGRSLALNLAKRTSASVVARSQWLKALLREAGAGDAVMRAAYERGLVTCSVEPVGPTIREVVNEVLEKAFSKGGFDRSIYSWKHLQDDLLNRPNLSKLLAQTGGEAVFQRRLSQLATIMGDDFDAVIAKNFAKVADEIIVVAKPDGTVDEFFEGFLRAFAGNPSELAHADAQTYSKVFLSPQGKAALKTFLSDPTPGKLWDTFDEATFFNNRVRGVLAELSVYKRYYKGRGYEHAPNAPGFDFTGPKWVQIKTVKDPTTAFSRMRDAVNALIAESPTDKPLKLHILVPPPGNDSAPLQAALDNYIGTLPAKKKFELIIDPFDIIP